MKVVFVKTDPEAFSLPQAENLLHIQLKPRFHTPIDKNAHSNFAFGQTCAEGGRFYNNFF